MTYPKILLRRGRTGLYRFIVVAKNGEPIATSEHYTTRKRAFAGAQALIETCKQLYENPDGAVVDLTSSS